MASSSSQGFSSQSTTIPSSQSENYVVPDKSKTHRAPVWDHFDRLRDTDGDRFARCLHCGKILSTTSNSTLGRQLTNEVCKKGRPVSKNDQMQIGRDMLDWQYNDQLCQEIVTKTVIQCDLSFFILDNSVIGADSNDFTTKIYTGNQNDSKILCFKNVGDC